MMRRVLVLVGVGLALSGCAFNVTMEPAADPEPIEVVRPDPAFDADCGDVLDDRALASIWGKTLAPRVYREAGAAGSWEMQGTGLLQDGALACELSTGRMQRPEVLMLALDDATDGFDLTESAFDDAGYERLAIGDTASMACRNDNPDAGTQCHINAKIDGVWASFLVQAVPDDMMAGDSLDPTSELVTVLQHALERLRDAQRTPRPSAQTPLPTCDTLLPLDTVEAALERPAGSMSGGTRGPLDTVFGSSNPTFGQVMWAYSFERQGYRECSYFDPETQVAVVAAPGGEWVLDDPSAIQGEVRDLPGLGRGIDACRSEPGFVACSTVVVRDGVLFVVESAGTDEEEVHATSLAVATVLTTRSVL